MVLLSISYVKYGKITTSILIAAPGYVTPVSNAFIVFSCSYGCLAFLRVILRVSSVILKIRSCFQMD